MMKNILLPGALLVLVVSALYINTLNASAQSSPTGQAGQGKPADSQHVGANGQREELLTGDLANRARDAALKAVPGGTVLKVETDAEGSPYEAHMRRQDGSFVTVKFDENFAVQKVEEGPQKSASKQL